MCPLRHANSSTSPSASKMIHPGRPISSSTSSSPYFSSSSSSSSTSSSPSSSPTSAAAAAAAAKSPFTSHSTSLQIRCFLSSLNLSPTSCKPFVRVTSALSHESANKLFYTLINSTFRVNAFIIIIVTTLAYWPCLSAQLVFDDQPAIVDNEDVKGSTPVHHLFINDYWGRSMTDTYSHKSYRPLTVLTFRLNYLIHQTRPFGYHLTNLVLHIIACLLFYRLANLWSKKDSLVATLIFSSHPIHTDAVTSVVGRAELLSAIFFLATLIVNLCPCERKKSHPLLGNINNNNPSSSNNNNNSSVINNNNNNNHSKVTISCSESGVPCKSHPFIGCTIFRHKLTVSAVLALLGFLCKEQCLSVLIFCALNELISRTCNGKSNGASTYVQCQTIQLLQTPSQSQLLQTQQFAKKRFKSSSNCLMIHRVAFISSLKFLLAFISALAFRFVVSGGSLTPTFNRFDNPASIEPSKTQMLTYAYLSAFNFWLLIFPFNLSCDWTHKSLPLVTSLLSVHFFVTVIFFTLLTVTSIKLLRSVYCYKSETSLQVLQALAILVVPFVPASNLFFRTGFVVAERVLYLPSIGFVLLLMLGSRCMKGRIVSHRTLRIASLLMVMCLAVKTYHRSCEWHDEISLFSSGLKVNPVNIKLLNNMGRLEEKRANFLAAVKYYKQALSLEDKSLRTYLNLGNLYSRLSKFEEAEAVYRKAKSLVEVEFFHQKRTSAMHKTALLRLLQVLSRDPSVDRMEETKKIQKLAQILTSAEAANGLLSSQQMNVKL